MKLDITYIRGDAPMTRDGHDRFRDPTDAARALLDTPDDLLDDDERAVLDRLDALDAHLDSDESDVLLLDGDESDVLLLDGDDDADGRL